MIHHNLIKITLVAIIALFSTAVVCNNLFSYDTNFRFVQHVLSMDTVFPSNRGHNRAITNPTIHHASYIAIIATELVISILCWLGVIGMIRNVKNSEEFEKSKKWALYGLTLGITLWFGGFIAIGGEWFMMWQSKIWNGQQAAFRITAVFFLALIFISQNEKSKT